MSIPILAFFQIQKMSAKTPSTKSKPTASVTSKVVGSKSGMVSSGSSGIKEVKTISTTSKPSTPGSRGSSRPNSRPSSSEAKNKQTTLIEEEESGVDSFYSKEIMELEIKEAERKRKEVLAKRPTKITASLVADKCLPEKPTNEEELFDKLFLITHLRLDRCNIAKIEDLDLYTHLTHVYLQCVSDTIFLL